VTLSFSPFLKFLRLIINKPSIATLGVTCVVKKIFDDFEKEQTVDMLYELCSEKRPSAFF